MTRGEIVASRTTVLLEDDLDGGAATETLSFAFEGKSYTIDLNDRNAAKFRKSIAPFVDAGRRDHGNSVRAPAQRGSRDSDASAVRSWAVSNGYEVSSRGRVRADLVAAYKAAGN